MKRLVYAFFAFIFLIFSVIIPDFSSFATDVTVVNSFGDFCYGYTADDLLFEQSYINNYSVDVNKEYLKYCCTYESYQVHNNNSDMGSNIMTIMMDSWSNNTYLQDTMFPDDLDGVHISQLYYYDYKPHLANFVIESDDLIIINGYLCSSQPFRYHAYYYDINSAGGAAYTNLTDYGIGTYDTINNDGFYSINMSNRLQWNLYSEVPIYYTAMKDVNYPNGDFLVDNYNYDSVTNIFNAVKNNTDDTGFVIDRRTEHMIEQTSGGGSGMNDIVTLDYDPTLFNGVLGFNWFNPSCTLNYNQHTSSYFPYYIVKYQINNYTDIHKTECSLIIDADIALKLNVNDPNNDYDGSGAYSTISHYHYNNELLLNDNLDGFTLFATTNSNKWTNTSLRTARGFNTATHLIPFNGDLTFDINNIISQWETSSSIDKINSYGVFRLVFYVRNNITGAVSETFTA